MSLAIGVPGVARSQAFGPATGRDTRVFGLALAASVALHALAMLIAPGLRYPVDTAHRPLEVSLVRPPAPAPEPVRPPPRAQPRPPEAVKPMPRAEPAPLRSRPTPAPAIEQQQVLALPEASTPAPSAFTVPQGSAEPPAPAAETKAAPAASGSAPREVASTPALYNAAYLRNAPPRYPLIARRNGVEGTVRLKVLVSRDGKPMQVQLDQSSGSAALDGAALDAVKTWQFVPARRGQDAIESWVLVPVVFRLEGTS